MPSAVRAHAPQRGDARDVDEQRRGGGTVGEDDREVGPARHGPGADPAGQRFESFVDGRRDAVFHAVPLSRFSSMPRRFSVAGVGTPSGVHPRTA